MYFRPGKLLLILSIPVVLFGAAKGFMYYKAKTTVDDIVVAASNQADIRYADISTELLGGAVNVTGITIQPRGYADQVEIDRVRVASDDPMFLISGSDWRPGRDKPPGSLAFQVDGLRMPVSADLMTQYTLADGVGAKQVDPCDGSLSIQPALLEKLGFTELAMDFDGHYRLDESALTLDVGMHMDIRDIQSMQVSATMTDVDVQALSQGGAPQLNLGGFRLAVRVAPEFGRQMLKACAVGSDLTIAEWGERYADRAIGDFASQGLLLGSGLQQVVREFYRDWGEFEIVSAPSQPVGLLSLMFLPPSQLADALALRLSLNEQLITDTRFTWARPDAPGLAALFGAREEEQQSSTTSRPQRVIVRRDYESVPASDLAKFHRLPGTHPAARAAAA